MTTQMKQDNKSYIRYTNSEDYSSYLRSSSPLLHKHWNGMIFMYTGGIERPLSIFNSTNIETLSKLKTSEAHPLNKRNKQPKIKTGEFIRELNSLITMSVCSLRFYEY